MNVCPPKTKSRQDRTSAKGEELVTDAFKGIRDYRSWLNPMGCSLSDAFQSRWGIEAPHAFSFKLRRDLATADVREVQTPGTLLPGNPNDVMCCVKTYMRDTKLAHVPTLVIPWGRQERVATNQPLDVKTVYELTESQVKNYLSLAIICDEQNLGNAALRLRALVKERRYEIPPAPWLQSDEPERLGSLELGEPLFPHLPAVSWKLVARFSP